MPSIFDQAGITPADETPQTTAPPTGNIFEQAGITPSAEPAAGATAETTAPEITAPTPGKNIFEQAGIASSEPMRSIKASAGGNIFEQAGLASSEGDGSSVASQTGRFTAGMQIPTGHEEPWYAPISKAWDFINEPIPEMLGWHPDFSPGALGAVEKIIFSQTSPLALAFIIGSAGESLGASVLAEGGMGAAEVAEASEGAKTLLNLRYMGFDQDLASTSMRLLGKSIEPVLGAEQKLKAAGLPLESLLDKRGLIERGGLAALKRIGLSVGSAERYAKGLEMLVDLGFTGQAITAAVHNSSALMDAIKEEDWDTAAELAVDTAATTGISYLGATRMIREARPALRGAAERFGFNVSPTREAQVFRSLAGPAYVEEEQARQSATVLNRKLHDDYAELAKDHVALQGVMNLVEVGAVPSRVHAVDPLVERYPLLGAEKPSAMKTRSVVKNAGFMSTEDLITHRDAAQQQINDIESKAIDAWRAKNKVEFQPTSEDPDEIMYQKYLAESAAAQEAFKTNPPRSLKSPEYLRQVQLRDFYHELSQMPDQALTELQEESRQTLRERREGLLIASGQRGTVPVKSFAMRLEDAKNDESANVYPEGGLPVGDVLGKKFGKTSDELDPLKLAPYISDMQKLRDTKQPYPPIHIIEDADGHVFESDEDNLYRAAALEKLGEKNVPVRITRVIDTPDAARARELQLKANERLIRTKDKGGNYTQAEIDNLIKSYDMALNPTPEMLALARDVRQGFTRTWDRAYQYNVIKRFLTDYVPHVWGKDADNPAANTLLHQANTFHVNVNAGLKRVFDSTYEGQVWGKKLEVADPIVLLTHQMARVGEAVAARRFLARLSGWKSGEEGVGDYMPVRGTNGQPLVALRGSGQVVKDEEGNPLRAFVSPNSIRPIYLPDELVKRWTDSGELKAALKSGLIKAVGDEPNQMLDHPPMVKDKIMQREVAKPGGVKYTWNLDRYESIDHPAFKDWNYATSVENSEGKTVPVLVQSEMMAHPEIVKFLKRWIGADKTIAEEPLVKGLLKVSSGAKNLILSGSPFHLVQLSARGVMTFGPRVALRCAIDALSGKTPDWNLNTDPVLRRLVEQTLTLGSNYGDAAQVAEGLTSGGSKILAKIPGIKQYQNWLNSATFEKLLPSLKVEAAKHLYERYLDMLGRRRTFDDQGRPVDFYDALTPGSKAFDFRMKLMQENPDLRYLSSNLMHDSMESIQNLAARLASQESNERFGMLPYRDYGRSLGTQAIMRLGVLAPDWAESELSALKRALDPFGTGKLMSRDILKFGAYMFALSRLGNMLVSGKPHAESPFGIVTTDKEGREKTWSLRWLGGDFVHAATDPVGFMTGRVSPLVRAGEQAVYPRDIYGRRLTPTQRWLDSIHNILPIPVQALGKLQFGELPNPIGNVGQMAKSTGVTVFEYNTLAQKVASQLASDHSEAGPVQEFAIKRAQTIMYLEGQIRSGQLPPTLIDELVAEKQLTVQESKQMRKILKETQGMPADVARLYLHSARLPLPEFLQVWNEATHAEKSALSPLMGQKVRLYQKKMVRMTPAQLKDDPTRVWIKANSIFGQLPSPPPEEPLTGGPGPQSALTPPATPGAPGPQSELIPPAAPGVANKITPQPEVMQAGFSAPIVGAVKYFTSPDREKPGFTNAVVQDLKGLAKGMAAGPVVGPLISQWQRTVAEIKNYQQQAAQPVTVLPGQHPGMIQPGNVNLRNRPIVKNADGTTSTEYSTSFEDDHGREVLVPTVVDGKFLTPTGKKPPEGSKAEQQMFDRAQRHYEQTGEHLGVFDNPEHANAYAEAAHNRGDLKPEIKTLARQEYDERRAQGRGVLYSLYAPAIEATGIINVRAIEAASNQPDGWKTIAGHLVVPLLLAASPLAKKGVQRALSVTTAESHSIIPDTTNPAPVAEPRTFHVELADSEPAIVKNVHSSAQAVSKVLEERPESVVTKVSEPLTANEIKEITSATELTPEQVRGWDPKTLDMWRRYRVDTIPVGVRNTAGEHIGGLEIHIDSATEGHVEGSHIFKGARGQGAGLRLYLRAMDAAKKEGLTTLRSDPVGVSSDAARVYDSFIKRGLPITKTAEGRYVTDLTRAGEPESANLTPKESEQLQYIFGHSKEELADLSPNAVQFWRNRLEKSGPALERAATPEIQWPTKITKGPTTPVRGKTPPASMVAPEAPGPEAPPVQRPGAGIRAADGSRYAYFRNNWWLISEEGDPVLKVRPEDLPPSIQKLRR